VKSLRWFLVAVVAVSWLSAAIFGAYILAFYGGMVRAGTPEAWNATLPRLYEPTTPAATLAIGVHFAMGGVLLLLGPIQLIARVRDARPAVHRWIGRLYVVAATLAGLGGVTFILAKGTIGGAPMDLGFGIYGALVVITAVATFGFGWRRDLDQHRAWAIRLYALAVGSWLYRMDYGAWAMIGHLAGHTNDFHGWFDHVMVFWFYIPNLLVAEIALRSRREPWRPALRYAAIVVLVLATLFIAVATVFFTKLGWGPGIISGITA